MSLCRCTIVNFGRETTLISLKTPRLTITPLHWPVSVVFVVDVFMLLARSLRTCVAPSHSGPTTLLSTIQIKTGRKVCPWRCVQWVNKVFTSPAHRGGSPLRDRVPKRLGSLQSRSAAYINAPSTKPICERTETQQNRSVDPVSLQFPSALQSGQH